MLAEMRMFSGQIVLNAILSDRRVCRKTSLFDNSRTIGAYGLDADVEVMTYFG